jgi:hypothetical protein
MVFLRAGVARARAGRTEFGLETVSHQGPAGVKPNFPAHSLL